MDAETIAQYLEQLSEPVVAKQVVWPHYHARNTFHLTTDTMPDKDSFWRLVPQYYVHHYCSCVGPGAVFEPHQAYGAAAECLDEIYTARGLAGSDAACAQAVSGLAGGLGAVLDAMAEHFRNKAIRAHVAWTYANHVMGRPWEEQVEFTRRFFERYGLLLPPEIDQRCPASYTSEVPGEPLPEPLVAYVKHLERKFSSYRRL